MLMKEIKEDTDRQRYIYHVPGLEPQYSENDYTTQSNLQIQCNPYQITNGIFHRIRTKKFPMWMETQSVLVAQSRMILHDPWTV